MISFKSFIEGINAAILSANNMLMARNEELLDAYFEPSDSDGNDPDGHEQHKTLKAKSICLEYPTQTANGMSTTHVDVPLVTLVPVTFPQIEKVKFTAQFDVMEVNNELQIHFNTETVRKKRRWTLFGRTHIEEDSINSGKLEITIVPSQGPEGVRKVIEGYEKALRSQIPH